MFLLSISETTVGLSLSINKIFQQCFAVAGSQDDEKYAPLSQSSCVLQFSQMKVLFLPVAELFPC